jgi:hypothetical protein
MTNDRIAVNQAAGQLEKLIDKIKKLLALAGSPNEFEASSAATRAAELMQEHQIVEAQLRIDDDETVAEPIIEGAEAEEATNRLDAWRFRLAAACANSVGAHAWTRSAWVDGKRGRGIKLFGRESAVQTATYQYQFLSREIERLANEGYYASSKRENVRSWKTSFCHGAVDRINQRLRAACRAFEQQAKAASTGTALAVIETDQKAVETAWSKYTAHFGRSAYAGPTSTAGYEAGQAKGNSVSLGESGKGIGAPSKQIGGRTYKK